MREILFRGKRIDNGEWIEGSLINDGGDRCFIAVHPSLAFGPTAKDIINEETLWGFYPFFEVDPATVGQYTGLTDKNGRKIFEGDIFSYITTVTHRVMKIDYKNGGFIVTDPTSLFRVSDLRNEFWNKYMEVIGNIHDNFELIGQPHE